MLAAEPAELHRPRHATGFVVALGTLFAYRLAFGLASNFFLEDHTQIYLIGLLSYATGRWPFFGPDVVWTKSQIPGAVQGLLVALPLRIVAAPESPIVLLNVLSFAAICLFAWYVTVSLPRLPRGLVYVWFLTLPWALHFSTQIINPSYVLPAAIVFFVGFFEAAPAFTTGTLRSTTAHAMLGLGLAAVAQLHMSWVLLVPYAFYAFIARGMQQPRAVWRNAIAAAAGAAVPLALVAPTFWRYGLVQGSGGVLANIVPHFVNPWILVTTLARMLSFASLEISRFLATDGPKRLELFQRHQWLIATGAIVWIAGLLQPLWMASELFRGLDRWPLAPGRSRWRALRRLVIASVLLVYVSYWFVMEPAQAHAFYVLAPIALLFSAYCWSIVDSPSARRAAAFVVVINIAFHGGLAFVRLREDSLYTRRDVVAAAIESKDPGMLGHRRAFARDAGPYELDTAIPRDPRRDLMVMQPQYTTRFDGSVHWSFVLENANPRVAYRDVLYFATYKQADGTEVQRHEYIKEIFEPCDVRAIDLNDGYIDRPFVSASIRVAAAEALVPASAAACRPR